MKTYFFLVFSLIFKSSYSALTDASFKVACKIGDIALIIEHIEAGLDINQISERSLSPLQLLVEAQHNKPLELVLKKLNSDDRFASSNKDFSNALPIAIFALNFDGFKLVLQYPEFIPQQKLDSCFLEIVECISTVKQNSERLKEVFEEKNYLPFIYITLNKLEKSAAKKILDYATTVSPNKNQFVFLNPVYSAFNEELFMVVRTLLILGANPKLKPNEDMTFNALFKNFISSKKEENNVLNIEHCDYRKSVEARILEADSCNNDLKQIKAEYHLIQKKNQCSVCNEQSKKKCSTCKLAYYCSEKCQRQNFFNHKSICQKTKELWTLMKAHS